MIRLLKAAVAVLVVVLSSVPALAQAADAVQALQQYERRVLAGDIAEYTYTVRVGDGPYDQIGLHRVVRETSAGQPIRTERAVFLAPGDIWNFRAAFLTGANPLPVFLAGQNVDVWGIDYRWTRVPGNVTDTSFMQSWGLEQDASDLGVALSVARFARTQNGNPGKLFLLGWSRGGQIGYAYLAGEGQGAPGLRHVEGFIPVDIYVKTDVPQLQAAACVRQQNSEASIAAGQHANPVGGLLSLLGMLAQIDPNGPSILDPNLTNRQAGLLVGQATFALLGGLEPVPAYHFTGGVFDANGAPAGLLYANEAELFAFEAAASPFQPNRELADADALTCGTASLNLGAIHVPVLYIGAGGGFGTFGNYTTTLLGSTDVTSLVVSKVPPAQRLFDYGHADLFLANDAQQQVWQPLLDWVNAR
ncbi:MAG TPA: hypothetical protein VEO54_28290 [Thermoanaerobaculia bacterium]|nr:hypothetical protein [Thermoanaerobaculia bacterium]